MHRERGQATPLVLAVVLLAALIGLGVAQVGNAAGRRSHVQAAADATALAAAAGGKTEAYRFAAANNASVVAYHDDTRGVTVEVSRDGVVAEARARWLPRAIP